MCFFLTSAASAELQVKQQDLMHAAQNQEIYNILLDYTDT